MSKKSGRGKNSPVLPEEVRNLIIRKVSHLRREHEERIQSTRLAIFAIWREESRGNIGTKGASAYLQPSLKAFQEIARYTTSATNEWPGVVWETIASTLEKAQVVLKDGLALNAIVDELAWAIGQKPFTFDYVDPERFKETVRREAERYGINHPDTLAEFDRQLKLASTAAQCGILNTASQARERIGITIEEHLFAQHQDGQMRFIDADKDLSTQTRVPLPSNKTGGAIADCLPIRPKNLDDWFLVIRDMALAFRRNNGRCPNETEAWVQLRTSPPVTYGITSAKHHGEEAIFMDGKALGKRAFGGRWRRYTAKS